MRDKEIRCPYDLTTSSSLATYPKLVVRHSGHAHGHRCSGQQGPGKGANQDGGHRVGGAQHGAQQTRHNGQSRVGRLAQKCDLEVLQNEDAVGADHQATQEAHGSQAAVSQQGVDYSEHREYGPEDGGQGLRGRGGACLALQDALRAEKRQWRIRASG